MDFRTPDFLDIVCGQRIPSSTYPTSSSIRRQVVIIYLLCTVVIYSIRVMFYLKMVFFHIAVIFENFEIKFIIHFQNDDIF